MVKSSSMVLLIVNTLLLTTHANVPNVCDSTKQMYRDTACCGGQPNTQSICSSKNIDSELDSIKAAISMMMPNNTAIGEKHIEDKEKASCSDAGVGCGGGI